MALWSTYLLGRTNLDASVDSRHDKGCILSKTKKLEEHDKLPESKADNMLHRPNDCLASIFCIVVSIKRQVKLKNQEILEAKNIQNFKRLLMGLSKNWKTQYIRVFGETWTYRDALESKAWKGHIESGLQLILQTYLQHQTLWPSMKSLRGEMTKAYYFKGTKPGDISVFLRASFFTSHLW